MAPHIYTEREIVDLLSAARRLGPAPGLRGATYEALFGLIASTGLRVSEALQLRNVDVDLKPADQVRQVAPSADAPDYGKGPQALSVTA